MYTENVSTAHLWQHSSHSTNINVCRVWWVRVGIQILRREFHAYIHLDYVRIKFLFYIKKMWTINLNILLHLNVGYYTICLRRVWLDDYLYDLKF